MVLKSFLRRGAGQDRSDEKAERGGYEITTAKWPNRSVIAFQKRSGQAAALEVTERGAEILQGLAAGAVISELEDVRSGSAGGDVLSLTSGEGASRGEAEAFIQSLDLLDGAEKRALSQALPR